MSYLPKPEFISKSQYKEGLAERINESNLKTQELYTLYLALDSEQDLAAMFPYRFEQRIRDNARICGRIMLLNKDLQDVYEVVGSFENDFFMPEKSFCIKADDESFKVVQTYTREKYTDDGFDLFLKQAIDLQHQFVGV